MPARTPIEPGAESRTEPSAPIEPRAAPTDRSPFEDAELYDALFGDLGYDRDFYVALAKQARGAVLEVTCGTGRVMIPCLQAGADVDGLDLHPQMLEALERKARVLGLRPRAYRADMRDFELPRRYALVFIPFNGFVHCLTTDEQLACLRACRAHLEPGGGLVFNVFFPSGANPSPEGVPVLEHEAPHPRTGLPVRIYDTRFRDPIAQIQRSEIEIQELDARGEVERSHRFRTEMRWTWKPELELLLRVAGFGRWEIFGDFDKSPLTRESHTMVAFAWKE